MNDLIMCLTRHPPKSIYIENGFRLRLLHDPPMLVGKTSFGLGIYNHTNFYRFVETSSYWSVKRISLFLCFSLVNQRHISGIAANNRTVTDIETTVRAVHSYNSSFSLCFPNCSFVQIRKT